MKKKIITILLMSCMALSLTACGEKASNSTEESTEATKKEYIEENELQDLFTSPDKYEGKYAKLSGQILVDPEKDGDEIALQVWNDPQNAERNFIVYYKGELNVKTNDYIEVDGRIGGAFKGENVLGGEMTVPIIEADTVETKSYIDAIVPTVKELAPNVSSEQHGLSVTVDKVEFADAETRLYLTIKNDGKENASYGVYNVRIIQDGKQIEQDQSSISSYEGGYPELSYDVTPGASTSGILVFPPIDQTKDFQVIVPDAYSDNYELEFKDFSLDIKNN